MPKLTVIYEDAGFKAVREVPDAALRALIPSGRHPLAAARAADCIVEVEAAKDAARLRDEKWLKEEAVRVRRLMRGGKK